MGKWTKGHTIAAVAVAGVAAIILYNKYKKQTTPTASGATASFNGWKNQTGDECTTDAQCCISDAVGKTGANFFSKDAQCCCTSPACCCTQCGAGSTHRQSEWYNPFSWRW